MLLCLYKARTCKQAGLAGQAYKKLNIFASSTFRYHKFVSTYLILLLIDQYITFFVRLRNFNFFFSIGKNLLTVERYLAKIKTVASLNPPPRLPPCMIYSY